MTELVLVRHGQTAWSRDRRHTGRTDVPLLDEGRAAAAALGPRLADRAGALVLCSPLVRAVGTAEAAGLGDRLERDEDLVEWDYGAYEGLTTAEIRRARPDWDLWRDGCPDGEAPADVGARTDRVLDRLGAADRDAILVAHGHLLRVLAARWLGLEPAAGALLALAPATISVLGHEHERPVVRRWSC